ncbi:hypothetical protein EDB80DRAFT_692972 [Ilyonectria destructans]|nr:hypothetical protein EDB80DRAFT_692972 [Ilyonectria destructans]
MTLMSRQTLKEVLDGGDFVGLRLILKYKRGLSRSLKIKNNNNQNNNNQNNNNQNNNNQNNNNQNNNNQNNNNQNNNNQNNNNQNNNNQNNNNQNNNNHLLSSALSITAQSNNMCERDRLKGVRQCC